MTARNPQSPGQDSIARAWAADLPTVAVLEANWNLPGSRIVTSVNDLDPVHQIPAPWFEVLKSQAGTAVPPWEVVWNGYEELLPAVFTFLRTQCLGVAALQTGKDPPALWYVAGTPVEGSYEGYRGELPCGDAVPPADFARRLLSFPPRLQALYRTVHNGWCGIMNGMHGPLPLESTWFLGEYLAETDCFEGRAPFRLADVLNVARVHENGTALCLDLGTHGPDGFPRAVMWHGIHGAPDLDVDFWSELNGMIEQRNQFYALRPDQIQIGRRVRLLTEVYEGLEGTIIQVDRERREAEVEVSLFGRVAPLTTDFLAMTNPLLAQ